MIKILYNNSIEGYNPLYYMVVGDTLYRLDSGVMTPIRYEITLIR